jgi:cell division protein ZapA
MAQISVTIAGRAFRMACEDGEEEHLTGLAATLDARIADMRKSFGEIGDQRLTVMAAISLADERLDALARLAKLEEDMARLRESALGATMLAEDSARQIAQSIDDAAARIEAAARALDGGENAG